MKSDSDLFLSEKEFYDLSLFLAYGAGLGILFGTIFNNISFLLCVGAVAGIVLSVVKKYVDRFIEKHKSRSIMKYIEENIKI